MNTLLKKCLFYFFLLFVYFLTRHLHHFFIFVLVLYIFSLSNIKTSFKKLRKLPVDIRLSVAYIKFILKISSYSRKKWTAAQIFLENVKKYPDRAAFKHEDKVWTFQQVEDYSNQVSNFFKNEGYMRGDAVAIFVESKPEYVGYWLGLAKIGIVSALINTNQRKDVLLHSIKIAKSKAVIVGAELLDAILEVVPAIPDIKIYTTGPVKETLSVNFTNIDKKLKLCSKTPLKDEIEKASMMDPFLYIYTSGTTGLPKAAVMTHTRFMFMALAVHYTLKLRRDDVIYTSLPLYHTAGGLIGVGQVLLCGSTQVLRSKFSASNFWLDCIKYKCTVAQYIGEMCRYLLAAPERPEEHQHNVRVVIGNGLRAQIWDQFVKRFNIKKIGEFYGSTEGNANMLNVDSRPGAVGYIPWFAKYIYPVSLIKVHKDSNEPIRNKKGFCIACKTGEPGLLVGSIKDSTPNRVFNGYADKKESEKKILRNVYAKGDKYFNTGDILVQDEEGYFYFKDRTGDTFRWKGENVATSEVEAVISNVVGLKDAIVYGVEIPNTEGKAGMAAIVDELGVLDFESLIKGMKEFLPAYERPIFLRVIKDVPITGTFKLKKNDLQSDGFNPNQVTDPLYFFNQSEGHFVPITEDLYKEIVSGKLKL